MTDVSGFAQVLDWVLLMNYDIWGCEWGMSQDLLPITLMGTPAAQPPLTRARTPRCQMAVSTRRSRPRMP